MEKQTNYPEELSSSNESLERQLDAALKEKETFRQWWLKSTKRNEALEGVISALTKALNDMSNLINSTEK